MVDAYRMEVANSRFCSCFEWKARFARGTRLRMDAIAVVEWQMRIHVRPINARARQKSTASGHVTIEVRPVT